jgi:hypothetical protein
VQREASGLPRKIILGTVSRDFGFLGFMQQQGVVFDVVGYRSTPRLTQALLGEDPWFGPGGALAQLAAFNRPVRITAFNCGEIRAAGYDDTPVQGVAVSVDAAACMASVDKHLQHLLKQTVVPLEAVLAYELTDRVTAPAPGNRFGLMVDLDTPKLLLALFSAFAGGLVSAAERQQLDALGLAGP